MSCAALIGKLVNAGLTRAGTMVFQKVGRTRKVASTLRGDAVSDVALSTAISDFETVIGSHYGQLTEDLDLFLRELEKSGLINAIVEQAICNRPLACTREAFLDMHASVIRNDDPESGEKLYQSLMGAIIASINEQVNDKALSLIIKAEAASIHATLDRVEASILCGSRSSKPHIEDITSVLLKAAKGLQNAYKNVRIETNKGARNVDITRIYVRSQFMFRNSPDLPNEIIEIIRHGAEKVDGDFDRISYVEFLQSFRRAVILGDPGGGKSTLCQYLCYDLARHSVLELQSGPREELSAQTQKIPFRVVLKSFELARSKDPQLDILTFIKRDLKNSTTCSDDEIDYLVDYCSKFGRAVFAFDGLDEILDTSKRREFADLVESFCDQYPLCPVIVTSRKVGYEDAPLTDNFEQILLDRFNRSEIKQYVQKFLQVVASYKPEMAKEGAKKFLDQTDKHATDLRANPLMLGLMSWLFYSKGDVPANRPEIYRECAVLMFEKWDQNRGIKADIPDDFDLLHLFTEIASRVYGNSELEDGVSRKWLENSTAEFFRDLYQDASRAIRASRSLTSFLTGRAWVMTEVGDATFKFTHRTFMEYFFARHLDERFDSVSEVMREIRPRIINNEWDVVTHLALQLKVFRNQRRIREAIEQLPSIWAGARSRKQKSSALIFAARALEYLPGTENDVEALVVRICESALDIGVDAHALASVFGFCSQCAPERRDVAGAAMSKALFFRYRDADDQKRLFILSAIYNSQASQFWGTRERHTLIADSARSRIFSELHPLLERDLKKNVDIAWIASEYFPDLARKAVLLHGVDLFFGTWAARVSPLCNIAACGISAFTDSPFGLPKLSSRAAIEGLVELTVGGRLALPHSEAHSRRYQMPADRWSKLIRESAHDADRIALIGICMFVVSELQSRTSLYNGDNLLTEEWLLETAPGRRLVKYVVERTQSSQFSDFISSWAEGKLTAFSRNVVPLHSPEAEVALAAS